MPRKKSSRYQPYVKHAQAGYVKPSWAKSNNWYQFLEHKQTYKNPHAHKHGISHPARILLIGQSGSGKTQAVLDILRVMDCHDEIYVMCLEGKEDPLYDLASKMFKGKKCIVTNGFQPKHKVKKTKEGVEEEEIEESEDEEEDNDKFPNIKDIPIGDSIQRAFIFDDVQAMPKNVQATIAEYNIAIRKHNGTVINIYHDFFETPKVTRGQATHIGLLPGLTQNNKRNFKEIASRFGDADELMNMYKICNEQVPKEIFWIDCNGPKEQRYRCGFDRVIDADNEHD